MFHKNNFFLKSKIYILLIFLFLPFLSFSCGGKKEVKEPEEKPIPKISLALSQLSGMKINGIAVEEIAKNPPETDKLDEEDLIKRFGIQDKKYLFQIMQLVQQQVESGKPLKYVSIHFAKVQDQNNSECAFKDNQGQCWTEVIAFDCASVMPQENWTESNYIQICQYLGQLKLQSNLSDQVAIFSGEGSLWPSHLSENIFYQLMSLEKMKWEKGKLEHLGFFSPAVEENAEQSLDSVGNEKAKNRKGKDEASEIKITDYYEKLKAVYGQHWANFFSAQSYRGKSLREIHQIWEESLAGEKAPVAFKEMVLLLRYLYSQGVFIVIHDSNPLFFSLPMMQRLRVGIPLFQSTGMDVALQDPENAENIKSMQDLVNEGSREATTQEFKPYASYDDFLMRYGDWLVKEIRAPIDLPEKNIKKIARQYLLNKSNTSKTESIDLDSFRTLVIAGAHFRSPKQTEFLSEPPLQDAFVAEDQNLLEVFPLARSPFNEKGGSILIWIQAWRADVEKNYSPYTQEQDNFAAFWKEQKVLHQLSLEAPLVQMAIVKSEAAEEKVGFRQNLDLKKERTSEGAGDQLKESETNVSSDNLDNDIKKEDVKSLPPMDLPPPAPPTMPSSNPEPAPTMPTEKLPPLPPLP
ncbi:MAG: hypothetical protein H7A32_03970 [Deltaproteobacteria bacterium]|nr:hypothetical protein [Deltaproteobacteria bacterium]